MTTRRPIAIVGSGVAGLTAGQALREHGYQGEISLFSKEADPLYERPALSKGFLTGEADDPPAVIGVDELQRAGITLVAGAEVVEIDRQNRTIATSRGRQSEYDQLLLACGAEPRQLEIPGSRLEGVHYLRELADARSLRRRLVRGSRIVVVGGGVIGLEVAASATAAGVHVTVVEAAPFTMGRILPAPMAELLESVHTQRGVAVQCLTTTVGFEAVDGKVAGVRLADDRVLRADAVLIGVGSIPCTRLASRAGLEVDDGIVVDEYLRTSDERIYAAGDAARVFDTRLGHHVRREQWQLAKDQGELAAASMLGVREPYRPVPWMWSDQFEFHIQATGFGFDGADLVMRGGIEGRAGVVCFGVRDRQLVAACGVAVGTGVARSIRAAQALIDHAVEIDRGDLADPDLDLRRLARAAI